jgi:hypothetical protein
LIFSVLVSVVVPPGVLCSTLVVLSLVSAHPTKPIGERKPTNTIGVRMRLQKLFMIDLLGTRRPTFEPALFSRVHIAMAMPKEGAEIIETK